MLHESRRTLATRGIIIGVAAALICFTIASLAAKFLIVSKPIAKPDAVVVLSGAATFTERTSRAAQIFNDGRSKRIILTNDNLRSGWSSVDQRNPYYFERAINELLRFGIPRTSIDVIGTPVNSTRDEAVSLRQYCDTHDIRSLLIVTSAYHSRRALAIFGDAFTGSRTEIGVEPVPTGIRTPSPFCWWLFPSGWRLVATEYVKLLNYKAGRA